jgi:MoaA/NifB/PqqE/SkfB family radical SAM enzyme
MCALINNCFAGYFQYGIIGNTIRIEVSGICQLKCPICIPQKDAIKGRGYMRFGDFKKIVDDNLNFKNVEISLTGEIFLNPELNDIIRYAHMKKLNITIRSGVNLNTVSEELLECLVKYRVRIMNISIDGASNDTYKIYRIGGNFYRVIENIKKINSYKKKYNSELPRLIWQFIAFGHNEHEIAIAKKMAKQLNMRFLLKLNAWNSAYSPVRNKEFLRKEIGYATADECEEKTHKIYMFACHQLWYSPQITWDGKLIGCSANCKGVWGDFGNVFESGLKNCLNSEKYIYTKKMLLGREKERSDIPCMQCDKYAKVKSYKINPIIDIFPMLLWFYQ